MSIVADTPASYSAVTVRAIWGLLGGVTVDEPLDDCDSTVTV